MGSHGDVPAASTWNATTVKWCFATPASSGRPDAVPASARGALYRPHSQRRRPPSYPTDLYDVDEFGGNEEILQFTSGSVPAQALPTAVVFRVIKIPHSFTACVSCASRTDIISGSNSPKKSHQYVTRKAGSTSSERCRRSPPLSRAGRASTRNNGYGYIAGGDELTIRIMSCGSTDKGRCHRKRGLRVYVGERR